jgi:hypothetical protein
MVKNKKSPEARGSAETRHAARVDFSMTENTPKSASGTAACLTHGLFCMQKGTAYAVPFV